MKGEQFFHCGCKLLDRDFSCIITFVYGANSVDQRRMLWSELLTLKRTINEPWMILGDFNECRSLEDKSGGNEIFSKGMEEFNDFCFQAELEEIRSSGVHLTWSSKCPSNPILRKLDRALVNPYWVQLLPSSEARILSPGLSDHSPIIIHLNIDAGYRKSFFKFFNFWSNHSDYLPIVQRI